MFDAHQNHPEPGRGTGESRPVLSTMSRLPRLTAVPETAIYQSCRGARPLSWLRADLSKRQRPPRGWPFVVQTLQNDGLIRRRYADRRCSRHKFVRHPAAHGLIQRGGIGQTLGLQRNQADAGLLRLLLRDEPLQIARRPRRMLLLHPLQRPLRGRIRARPTWPAGRCQAQSLP